MRGFAASTRLFGTTNYGARTDTHRARTALWPTTPRDRQLTSENLNHIDPPVLNTMNYTMNYMNHIDPYELRL